MIIRQIQALQNHGALTGHLVAAIIVALELVASLVRYAARAMMIAERIRVVKTVIVWIVQPA